MASMAKFKELRNSKNRPRMPLGGLGRQVKEASRSQTRTRTGKKFEENKANTVEC